MIYEKGNFYHLYNRGCNTGTLFINPEDYSNLTNRIIKSNFPKYLNLKSYCLMPNHCQFLVQQKKQIPRFLNGLDIYLMDIRNTIIKNTIVQVLCLKEE